MAIITSGDIMALFLRAVDEDEGLHLLQRFVSGRTDRVKLTWRQERSSVRNWDEIPLVARRQQFLVTGDERVSTYDFVAGKYLDGDRLNAVSIGCGAGARELAWAETGKFERIVGIDISEERIEKAKERATKARMQCEMEFIAADFLRYPLNEGSYDVVLAEGALHHLSPLGLAFAKILAALRPGGILVMNDYVGPDRFQWTRQQLKFCNGLLAMVPDELRTYRGTSIVKRRVLRPGTLAMRIHDPSEAVEPSGILGLVHKDFEIVSQADYGGTVLHPILKDIAHHFSGESPESLEVLQFLFAAEDYLLKSGRLGSDFTFVVGRKK